ncbi:acylglycerol kinase, mitochondrial [Planococcus citri]|uniref:acylglycerol kinase, mitochondrial n=1 Tax=Planococcus citri TaxID=170843 RepID=UPI0031F94249
MAKVLKFGRWVRNNWKKSVFFSVACYYGGSFIKTEFDKNSLVRQYSKEAVKFGDVSLPVFQSPRHILVILNPAANKKKALKEYEKYCAPLLHLSGAKITLLQSSDEYGLVQLTKAISEDVDAVVVAGGDGAISEVITGIFYQKMNNSLSLDVPLGIIPVGRSNTIAKKLYSAGNSTGSDALDRVKLMMDATYSIVRELTFPSNVIEAQTFGEKESTFKPVYTLGHLQWGALRDAREKMDKYWYFGGFRQYAAYVFGSNFNSPFEMKIQFTPPCSGCSKCYKDRFDKTQRKEKPENRRWWHAFVPRTSSRDPKIPIINYETIHNENCDKMEEKSINSVELIVSPEILDGTPSLRVQIGPKSLSYTDFVKEGCSREHPASSALKNDELYAQNLYVIPNESQEENSSKFSIAGEIYETSPIKVSLLHKVLPMFSPS